MKTDKYLQDADHTPTPISVSLEPKDADLWQRYQAKKADSPMLFPTEGAKALGISELQLLASSPTSQYLGSNCKAMLGKLHRLGEVEHIVRNDFAVHEKQAKFINLNISDVMGISMGEGAFDLRFFMKHWQHMLAIDNGHLDRPSYCIAFFDGFGQAISKVFLKDKSDEAVSVWHKLIAEFANDATAIDITSTAPQGDWRYHKLDEASLAQFHQDWRQMTDIHQFHGILGKYQLDRVSSYHQAPTGCTTQVDARLLETLFEKLVEKQIPMMTFVGSTGVIQIQSDTLRTVKRLGDWLNILDKNHSQFTLHLKDTAISQLWCIKRPNSDGFTTAFEGFDAKGNSILTLFGVRTEGVAQDPRWQELADELAHQFAIC